MTRSSLKAALAALALLPTAAGLILAAPPAGAASPRTETLAGAYLAGRAAAARKDFGAAAQFFAAALARDPDEAQLRDRTLTYQLLTGDLRGASTLAGPLLEAQPDHRLAGFARAAFAIAQGDFEAAEARLSDERSGVNPLVGQLLRGWAAVGRDDAEAMEAAFAGLGDSGMSALFGRYHLGLARAAMGELEGAQEALEAALDGGASRTGRPALALGAVLERLGRSEEAREIYRQTAQTPSGARHAQAELARMEAGEPAALPVRSARAGAAEALHTIAAALGADRNATVALLYANTALALRPELDDARLLIGGLLAEEQLHEAAAEAYGRVPRSSPRFVEAEMGKAESLIALERLDEAIRALRGLAEAYPDSLDVQLAHAAALRRAERWEESAAAYDAAIGLIEPVESRHWTVFYQRGIAHERAGRWPRAESDFLKALELEPDQPLVLNYLGYSWVEMRKNLERAQEMIELAVEQRPEDGYITDSLGWVLYRIGKYQEAVPHLERAVALAPTDPIINDHLGDALWMVGRKREAAFQWRRALSFDPEEDDAERIRRKLKEGLDAVLAEEEASATEASSEAGAGTVDGG
ncbi:MAG: tetratricopeptide repeat protein [Pseudomonadota bacterium]